MLSKPLPKLKFSGVPADILGSCSYMLMSAIMFHEGLRFRDPAHFKLTVPFRVCKNAYCNTVFLYTT